MSWAGIAAPTRLIFSMVCLLESRTSWGNGSDYARPSGSRAVRDQATVRRRESRFAQHGFEWRVHRRRAIHLLQLDLAGSGRDRYQRLQVWELHLAIGEQRLAASLEEKHEP